MNFDILLDIVNNYGVQCIRVSVSGAWLASPEPLSYYIELYWKPSKYIRSGSTIRQNLYEELNPEWSFQFHRVEQLQITCTNNFILSTRAIMWIKRNNNHSPFLSGTDQQLDIFGFTSSKHYRKNLWLSIRCSIKITQRLDMISKSTVI